MPRGQKASPIDKWEMKERHYQWKEDSHSFYIGNYNGIGDESLVEGKGTTKEAAKQDAIAKLSILNAQIENYLAVQCQSNNATKPKEVERVSSE